MVVTFCDMIVFLYFKVKFIEMETKISALEEKFKGETESLEQLQLMFNAEELENDELKSQLAESLERSEDLLLSLETSENRYICL